MFSFFRRSKPKSASSRSTTSTDNKERSGSPAVSAVKTLVATTTPPTTTTTTTSTPTPTPTLSQNNVVASEQKDGPAEAWAEKSASSEAETASNGTTSSSEASMPTTRSRSGRRASTKTSSSEDGSSYSTPPNSPILQPTTSSAPSVAPAMAPMPMTYAGMLKKAEPKPTRSVKPCSHAVVAATPRLPPPNQKKSFTPPSTPLFGQAKLTVVRSLSEDGSNTVEKTSSAVVTADGDAADGRRDAANTPDGRNSTCDKSVQQKTKTFINQEAKFQQRIQELTSQLDMKDSETSNLKMQIESLQKDVYTKAAGMERLQAELRAAQDESISMRQKIHSLEEDLFGYKRKNLELADDVMVKNEEISSLDKERQNLVEQLKIEVEKLMSRIRELEEQINALQQEKNRLEQKLSALQDEKTKECQVLQEAIDNAVRQKQMLQQQWEAEFEILRTRNSEQQQQMLNDFEWKLREIEQKCKRRVEDKEKASDEKIKKASKEIEAKVRTAEQQMNEVKHLKSYEAEVNQLRGLTHDQQRSLTAMSKQTEELQVSERNLKEEMDKLKTAVEVEKGKQIYLQNKFIRDYADKERMLLKRLDQQKSEIALQWENRLRHECCRLKTELDQLNGEERQAALEMVRQEKDADFQKAKLVWERKVKDCFREISSLKKALKDKEDYYHNELESCHTKTDRDIIELRRTIDKMDMAFHNRIEKLIEDHEQEIDSMNEEAEKRLQDVQSNYELQISAMRSAMDVLKSQMQNESEEKIVSLIEQHKAEIVRQRENLQQEKINIVRQLESEYSDKFEKIEQQINEKSRTFPSHDESELINVIEKLKGEIGAKDKTICELQNNIDTLHGGVQVLNEEISGHCQDVNKVRAEAGKKMRELQDCLANEKKQQQQERAEHIAEVNRIQKQSQAVIDQLQRKCQCLTKLFEEIRQRYDNRESRKEDINAIADLRQVIAEQEKDIAILNEEKRFYQMKLMQIQSNDAGDSPSPDKGDLWNGDNRSISVNGDSGVADMYMKSKSTSLVS